MKARKKNKLPQQASRPKVKTEALTKEAPLKKVDKVKTAKEKATKSESSKSELQQKPRKYIYAVGRRKAAIARIQLFTRGEGKITINNKNLLDYFPYFEFQEITRSALKQIGQTDKLNVICQVKGGGSRGQAESIRLGMARALVKLNPNFKKALKKVGYLSRDARVKERKKPGLKRARRAPQWQKR